MESGELVWFMRGGIFPAAFALLPGRMDSLEARAMLLAIGLQESGFEHRRQVGGPARGFWQFEKGGGVAGVITNSTTGPLISIVCHTLGYVARLDPCYTAIEHNDVLAACFARLLLYTDPAAMPQKTDPDLGWRIYLRTWRPGKPRLESWHEHFDHAWRITEGVV